MKKFLICAFAALFSCSRPDPVSHTAAGSDLTIQPAIRLGKLLAISDIDSAVALVSGDNLRPDTVSFYLVKNASRQSLTGTISVPAEGETWMVTIKLFDAAHHKIGQGAQILTLANVTSRSFPMSPIGIESAKPRVDSLKCNFIDSTYSIGDSINLHATASDSFGGTVTGYEWAIGSGAFAAGRPDTTIIAPSAVPAGGIVVCRIRVTDDDGNKVQDSIPVGIIRDVSAPYAGVDTQAVINSPVNFRDSAFQRFGTIKIYKWDFDNNGTWDDSSATPATYTHRYFTEGADTARLYVRDDDGNDSIDTRVITIVNNAPVFTLMHADTTISIKDSIVFTAHATDSDDSVMQYAWDVNGDGSYDDSAHVAPIVGRRYMTDGSVAVKWRARDNYGKATVHTVTVTVEQDAPVVNAGADTLVPVNGTVKLQGNATQNFGTFIDKAWSIDGAAFVTTADGSKSIAAPATGTIIHCTYRVTDDDSNIVFDSCKIFITRQAQGGMKFIPAKNQSFTMGNPGMPLVAPYKATSTGILTHDFWMDSTEVTQVDFDSVMGVNDITFINQSDPKNPAENISWYDAALYCNQRSKKEGKDTVYSYSIKLINVWGNCYGLYNMATDTTPVVTDYTKSGYRLPSEIEWEYACRAGTTGDSYWGSGAINNYVWYYDNASNKSHPVGQKLANGFGMYDMMGNVSEFCNDVWTLWTDTSFTDFTGPQTGTDTRAHRTLRGYGYDMAASYMTSGRREESFPDNVGVYKTKGFRAILPVVP
jgi:formylglycine-generating enzyme required for sulfatase activity